MTKIEKMELKPCPFCGEMPVIKIAEWDEFGMSRMELKCCMYFEIEAEENLFSRMITGNGKHDRVDPIERWNRRAHEQTTGEEEF